MDTTTINLLDWIGRYVKLKKVSSHSGGEFAGACPFCGGSDRFRVWPNNNPASWWCRQCERKGDVIDFVMQLDNVTFGDALQILGLDGQEWQREIPVPTMDRPTLSKPKDDMSWVALTDPEWQAAAHDFVDRAFDTLHFTHGKAEIAWEYLAQRGLTEAVVAAHYLGFNPEEYRGQWGSVEVWLPRGIVLPWFMSGMDDDLWKVNVRRLDGGKPKYIMAKGSANGLYGTNSLFRPRPIVMVEGEIDALSLWVAAPGMVIPVAIGSTQGARLSKWIATIATMAAPLLLAFDQDEDGAGDKAAAWWQSVIPDALRLVPTRHDVNDMLLADDDIVTWLEGALCYSCSS